MKTVRQAIHDGFKAAAERNSAGIMNCVYGKDMLLNGDHTWLCDELTREVEALVESARREAHKAGLREGLAKAPDLIRSAVVGGRAWTHDQEVAANALCAVAKMIEEHIDAALSAPPAAPGEPVCQFVDKAGKVCGGTSGGDGRHDWHHPFQAAPKEGTTRG